MFSILRDTWKILGEYHHLVSKQQGTSKMETILKITLSGQILL